MQTIQSQLNILAKCAGGLNTRINSLENIQDHSINIKVGETDTTLSFTDKEGTNLGTFTFEYIGKNQYKTIQVANNMWIKEDGTFTSSDPKVLTHNATNGLDDTDTENEVTISLTKTQTSGA